MSNPLFLSPQPFRAASSTAAGLMGLVPSPATGQQGYFLRGDATWVSAEAFGLPSQTGANGKVLSSDGVNSFWATSIGPLTSSSINGPLGGTTPDSGAFTSVTATSTSAGATTVSSVTKTPVAYPTGGSFGLRFDLGSYAQIDLTINMTLTASSGMVRGRTQTLDITNPTGGTLTLSWPVAWRLVNGALPVSIVAGKSIRVELNCASTTEASIIASYQA